MLRVRLVAGAIVAIGVALTGCSTTPAPPPTLALQFESAPPGAEVRTPQGQTCKTPCSLALPLTNQSINFALNGYVPQTVAVEVRDATAFAPNPVEVTLQAVPKPAKPKPGPKTAAAKPATPSSSSKSAPGQDSAFPPPPPMSPSPSPFPPPPVR